MSKNIVHQGGPADVMPWTNGTGSAVAVGSIIKMKNTLAVAIVTIADGAVGSVAVGGVISGVPKTTGQTWSQGESLQWDVSASKFANSGATPATGDVTGGAIAWLSALSGDATGTIKLTPGNTTVT